MTPKQALKKVAEQEGISVEEVRREIQKAINIAMQNPDPDIQRFWRSIPSKGAKPTPEETVLFLCKYYSAN